jgi:histidinol-phosphatase
VSESDLQLAVRAALTGAAVGLRHFAALSRLPLEHKADGSVVTVADREVEARIRAVLAAARPHDAVLGEEAGQCGDGDRRWIIDPIDGTAMFVAGDDRWLVLVALEEAGEVVAGVAAVPALSSIWWAARGAGAYTATVSGTTVSAGRRVTVSDDGPDTVAGSRLGVVPADSGILAAERPMLARLTAHTGLRPWPVHPALLVAGGRLDLAVQTRGHTWDFAATTLIVTEAGGHVTGLDGDHHPTPGPRVFARSEALHADALRILRAPAPGS